MSLIRRAVDWWDPPARPIANEMPTLGRAPERRAGVTSWDLIGRDLGRSPVSHRQAENIGAVFACGDVIATGVGSLPPYVYRVSGKARTEDMAHPLAEMIRAGVNENQTWPDFIEWLLASTVLRGNGLAEIVSDGSGRILALRPVPWEYVQPQQLKSGALVYDIVEHIGLFGATGRPKRLLAGEVLHLRDRTDDGLIGRSRISRAASVVRASAAVQAVATDLYENGLQIRGVLQTDKQVGEQTIRNMRDDWESLYSGATGRKTVILDQGIKFEKISMSAEDAELLKGREFSVAEIARLYRVPPPLIQDYSKNTFTNAEQAGRWFGQHSLRPWVVKLEAAIKKQVLGASSPYEISFDLGGIMRGDHAARWSAHKTAVDARILTRNEVREVEGYNPVAGGDTFDTPAAAPAGGGGG